MSYKYDYFQPTRGGCFERTNMTHHEAERRRRQITAEITRIGFCLPGSLTENFRRCSTTGCHCHHDPASLHGPYRVWTRKISGKTVTRTLSADQYERYRPWIENAKRLHELVAELEQLSAAVMADQETWPEPAAPPPDRRRAPSLTQVGNGPGEGGR